MAMFANALMRPPGQAGGQLSGQLPGQGFSSPSGPGFAQPLAQHTQAFPPTTLQMGQMPMVGQNVQYQTPPGFNQGTPQPPSGFGQFPTSPGGVMQPGGGNAPPPQFLGPPTQGGAQGWQGLQGLLGNQFPDVQGLMNGFSGYRNALSDWRGQRPQFSYDPSLGTGQGDQRGDWRTQMRDWRQQRPQFNMGGFSGGGPQFGGGVMQPGGGVGVPGTPGGPPLQPGGPVNPAPAGSAYGVQGTVASTNPYQLPTYSGG